MAEFDEKLNSILSNPDAMSQIMQLAQSLGGDGQSAAPPPPGQPDPQQAPAWGPPPPQQTPEEAALAAYQAAFGWAGPAPVFIDLTDDGGVKDKGKSKVDDV